MSTATAFDHHARPFLDSAHATHSSLSPHLLRKVEALRALGIFAGASEAELFRLAESSLLRRFERGRPILRGGSAEDCVVLLQGRAKTTMPRGVACGEFALALLEAGDIVSEGCWARHAAPDLGETVALEASVLLFMPRRALDQLLSRNARVAFQLMEAIVAKLRRVLELAVQNSCLEVGDRLYRKLMELSVTRGTPEQGGVRIEHGLFQSELAAGIGASREAVNRQLALWREQGLIETGRRFVMIKDPFGLSMAVSAGARGAGLAKSPAEGCER
jgi:CRP/FNR family cyclic AMP-dependent transcriptional regulator